MKLSRQPITDFKSDRVRALLAFLAVEVDRPHRRDVLAGLLWPDWPDRDALGNLRSALANLRRAIGDHTTEPPFLLITRGTLQFNAASDYWLDVKAFTKLVEVDRSHPTAIDQLQEAANLYQGSFLEGFSIGDSPAFEDWALFTRERLARQVTSALHYLVDTCMERGEYEQAQSYGWRLVRLESWDEKAHQQLMAALALGGQRSAALAQYETCRRLLSEELGVEPGEETTKLYEQIRDGKLRTPVTYPTGTPNLVAESPSFLDEAGPPQVERPIFVAREPEMMQLEEFLEMALSGKGRVVFVTGEAGSGKTTLVQEFIQRALKAHADPSTGSGQALLAASGNCNAYTGIGDPYLPFREILELLTGNVQARWAAGAMTGEHAHRLWNTLPLAAQALLGAGPDLLGTFLPHAALLERTRACTQWPGRLDWAARLNEVMKHRLATVGAPSPQQGDVFKQYTDVLKALARQVPLVLVVDDLQWADAGSINLLFHMGRQLAGSRILIVGTYRPEEIALGRDGERHPLEPVVNEFQRLFGGIAVNLDQAKSWDFVEAALNSEPNQLGLPFREMLHRQTRGHALSTIEVLRGMQERGDLVQDQEGHWVEGPALDWETLPARVEAVVAERIDRLAQPLQAALQVASVEGEEFTAEVVAQVLGTGERETVQLLSSELDRKHRLVRAQAIERLGSRRLSRYRFRHFLFQKYLYDSLDQVERSYLHEDVGNALEELYSDQATEVPDTAATAAVAVQLARHFQKAGRADKAIHYLHFAGKRAVQLSAHQEGIAHLTRGLELLKAQPDPGDADRRLERTRQELALQLTLGMAWVSRTGYGLEGENAYTRAGELCRQLEETSQLCLVLGRLSMFHYTRSEHQRALELAEEALGLAQHAEDPLHVALGHRYLGSIFLCLGEYPAAQTHLEQMISFYEPGQHHRTLVYLRGSDAGTSALAYLACCLWCLGYPEQALRQSQGALAVARELNHPFSLADVLCYAGCMLSELRRDAQALEDYARELGRRALERDLVWSVAETCFRGEALIMLGQVQEGMALLHESMGMYESVGILYYLPGRLCFLAEAQAKAGHSKESLATLGEALAWVEETGERYWEAELHRQRGELLLRQGDEAGAEARLHKAIKVARRQSAKSWELRATVSLCRLWQEQGRADEARQMLSQIYGWFTEGFDTPDLQEAKALLEALSTGPHS